MWRSIRRGWWRISRLAWLCLHPRALDELFLTASTLSERVVPDGSMYTLIMQDDKGRSVESVRTMRLAAHEPPMLLHRGHGRTMAYYVRQREDTDRVWTYRRRKEQV